MALSTIHDVANHGPQHAYNATPGQHVLNSAHMEHGAYPEKNFRPNPDAKPFVPSPFAVAPTNWQNVNGFLPPFWVQQPPVNHENLMTGNTSKKHIAFHLVSNLLDDEVPEDISKEHITMNYPHHLSMLPKQHNIHNNTSNNVIDTWHESESNNFNLPIAAEQTSDKSSINNKSIHEIWSPDPSPNDLNNLSPSEEVMSSYNQQVPNQLLDSPSSAVDSPDISFEQVQNDMINQQMYNEVEHENQDGSQQPQYCYQNLPSPVYQHHHYNPPPTEMYRNPPTEMYTVLSPRNNNMMNNNMRPVVVEPRGYYPNPQYMNRYPVDGYQPKRRSYRHPSHDQEPVLQITYESRMTCVEELGICIDECRDQLKHLERDCRKVDSTLSQEFRLRKTSFGDSCTAKYPSNSTRVDKLIVDQQKEHQKIESLIGRIERLGFNPMHPNVGDRLDRWSTAIKELRNARKNELANISDTMPHGGHHGGHHGGNHGGNHHGKSHTQSDVSSLVGSVKELTKLTRYARTIVWCAMQMLYGNSSGE